MRGLGLIALLVVVAIVFVLWTQNASTVSKVNKDVRPQAERIAGVDESGQSVAKTYTLEAVDEGGRFRGMRVVTLAADSVMKSRYGLQQGDIIVEAGGQGGVTMRAGKDADAGALEAQVFEAYRYNQPLTVMRDGKEIKLTPEAAKLGLPR